MLIKEIKNWGAGSKCIPVPKSILELLNLKIKDKVTIEIKDGKIVISPVKKENTKK